MKDKFNYWPQMIVDLEALGDDLVANDAPVEAVRHVQEAVRLCRERYERDRPDSAA